jgi:hypothetical protein
MIKHSKMNKINNKGRLERKRKARKNKTTKRNRKIKHKEIKWKCASQTAQ